MTRRRVLGLALALVGLLLSVLWWVGDRPPDALYLLRSVLRLLQVVS